MRALRGTGFRGVVALAAIALAYGCADTSWEAASTENSVAGYHQFLRDHADSEHTATAEERIAYLRMASRPTIPAYEEFEKSYPSSGFLAELRPQVEELYFQRARETNTVSAYKAFLARFPSGALADKARGNLFYVGTLQPVPTAVGLREFAARYPKSDFAPAAQRTLELVDLRQKTSIDHLALRIDVAADVPAPERVRRGFASVISEAYRSLGVSVAMLGAEDEVPTDVEAWMHVDYHEAPAQGTFGGQTLISNCRIRLYNRGAAEPVWDRHFEAPAEHRAKRAHGSDPTLFGSSRYRFWEEFFVPLSTWATSLSRVAHREYAETVVGVDVTGDRAAVLFASGGVEYLDVSNPVEPRVVSRYRRQHDLTRWDGVRVLPHDRVVLFGVDGIEVVSMDPLRTQRIAVRESSEIGAIRDAAVFDPRTLLMVGNEGVWGLRLEQANLLPHRLVEREYVGIAVKQGWVYLVGTDHVDTATPKQLVRKLTGPARSLGERFEAKKVRMMGDVLYVFGHKGIVQVDISRPDQAVPTARLESEELGSVRDLAADAHHLYVVGNRGLQIADRRGESVTDRIQVSADKTLVSQGRFLYLAGQNDLEIVDISPYRESPASPAGPIE